MFLIFGSTRGLWVLVRTASSITIHVWIKNKENITDYLPKKNGIPKAMKASSILHRYVILMSQLNPFLL